MLLCSAPVLRAQHSMEAVQEMADSTVQRLLTTSGLSDSTRMFAQHWDATFYVESASDSALAVLGELRKSELAAQDDHFRAWLLFTSGTGLDVAGKSDSALVVLHEAKRLFEELEDIRMIGASMTGIAIVHYFAGDNNQAVTWYNTCAAWWEAHPGYDQNYAKVLNNMAIIYRQEERFAEAISAYKQAIAIKRRLGEDESVATSLSNLGLAYSKVDSTNESIRCFEEALRYFIQQKDTLDIAHVRMNLGTALVQEGKLGGGLAQLHLSRKLFNRAGNSRYLPHVELYLAHGYRLQGKFDQALSHAQAAETMLDGKQWQIERVRLLQEFAGAYSGLGEWQKAYGALTKADSLREAFRDDNRLKELDRLQTQFDVERTKHELDMSRLEQAQQAERDRAREEARSARIILVAVVGIMVLIAGVSALLVYRRNNRRLAEKNAIIATSLEEKEVLLREIHHRVKNNLQMISSLLSIQARGIDDAKALEAVQLSRSRVKSMAIIHQNLYQEDNLTGIDMSSYVDKLMTSLFTSYQSREREVTWEADVQAIRLDVDTAIPIGLILNELVTNSLKHAFNQNDEGLVHVRLEQREDHLLLEVADNGVGMGAGDLTNATSASYGMKMLRAFAEKLKATIHHSSDHGTTISLAITQYKVI